ncbi:hypothetical protein ABTM52_20095, partial [Acinetobacter baumannii]
RPLGGQGTTSSAREDLGTHADERLERNVLLEQRMLLKTEGAESSRVRETLADDRSGASDLWSANVGRPILEHVHLRDRTSCRRRY